MPDGTQPVEAVTIVVDPSNIPILLEAVEAYMDGTGEILCDDDHCRECAERRAVLTGFAHALIGVAPIDLDEVK